MLTKARRIFSLGLWMMVTVMVSAPIANADVRHGHDCATAATIKMATAVRGIFTDTHDRAVYRIVLERRGLLDVWTDPFGELDIWNVELLNSACNVVPGVTAGHSLISGELMNITVPNINSELGENVCTLDPGVYFLRFDPDPVGVLGESFVFHTKYTPHYGHDYETAAPIALSSSIDGALLYPEDREVFHLTLTESGVIHAWTAGSVAPASLPGINLRFPDSSVATEIMLDDGTGKGILTPVLKPGDYYLSLGPRSVDVPGPFTLHTEFTPQPVSENNAPQ